VSKTISFPSYDALDAALLEELRRRGPLTTTQAYAILADRFGLDKDHRTITRFEYSGKHADGYPATDAQSEWENQVQWARRHLKDKGLLQPTKRGVWAAADNVG